MRDSTQFAPKSWGSFVVIAAFLAVAGCDNKSSSERDRAERTIVLHCTGNRISPTDSTREPGSYLIKIDPFNQFQTSLHFFSSAEKMFISPCESKFPECKVSVTPDMISEVGAMRLNDNQIAWTEITEINRRTGSMTISRVDQTLGNSTLFEGSCTKSEMPAETEQKF